MSERSPLVSAVNRFRRRLTRATMPRLVLRATRASHALQERALRARSALGSSPRVELYFAFDDPYGVIAVREVAELSRRYGGELVLYPLVDHGILPDPDLRLRRAYALKDADRLLRRSGSGLARTTEIDRETVRFLAAWTQAAQASGAAGPFAVEAISQLWLSDDGPIEESRYREIYERTVRAPPPHPSDALDAALAHNAARLRSRGHWETPAARIAGEWFFAHERIEQMGELLVRLRG